jgi:hypothetical protein
MFDVKREKRCVWRLISAKRVGMNNIKEHGEVRSVGPLYQFTGTVTNNTNWGDNNKHHGSPGNHQRLL